MSISIEQIPQPIWALVLHSSCSTHTFMLGYLHKRSSYQSVAVSWTWGRAAHALPAACTALGSSPSWWGHQQTCSSPPSETQPEAAASLPQGQDSYTNGGKKRKKKSILVQLALIYICKVLSDNFSKDLSESEEWLALHRGMCWSVLDSSAPAALSTPRLCGNTVCQGSPAPTTQAQLLQWLLQPELSCVKVIL